VASSHLNLQMLTSSPLMELFKMENSPSSNNSREKALLRPNSTESSIAPSQLKVNTNQTMQQFMMNMASSSLPNFENIHSSRYKIEVDLEKK
jgi:hypothetical protein